MSDAFTGEIRIFPYFRKNPYNWLPCDGRTLSITEYPALYSIIGTRYGGDGTKTFGLPDFKGRTPVGQGTLNRPPAAPVTYSLGQTGGTETVSLSQEQGASHTHTVNAATTVSTSAVPGPTVMMAAGVAYKHYCTVDDKTVYGSLADTALDTMGGNQSHVNVMPSIGLDMYICINGIYPQKP